MEISEWFPLAVLTAVLFSLSNFLPKVILSGLPEDSWLTRKIPGISSRNIFKYAKLKSEVNPAVFTCCFYFMVGTITAPFAISNPASLLDIPGKIWLITGAAALLLSAGSLYYWALKKVEMREASIITATEVLWITITGFIFLGEAITKNKSIGISMILVGIIVFYWQKGLFQSFRLPHLAIFAFLISSTTTTTLNKYMMQYFAPIEYLSITRFVSGIFIMMAIVLIKPTLLKKAAQLLKNPVMFTMVLINIAGYISFFYALKVGGEISRVVAVIYLQVIIIYALSYFILNERESWKTKLIAVFLVLVGACSLRFS